MNPVSTLSVVTVWCTVEAKKGGVSYNPSADPVFAAFVAAPNNPSAPDWHVALWEPCQDPNIYSIGGQVGPGVVPLTAGVTYGFWVKFQDAPDVPVFLAGTFKAF